MGERIEGMKHIVCYSGGHSSALVAIMVAQRHGAENTILLNHDISENVEDADIKRFKEEIAQHLGIKITYANMDGWETEYPLATWAQTIKSTKEIGIEPPLKYGKFKHANCTGCIKGGAQHWYVVYCERPDIFERAKEAEEQIGYSILKDGYLKDIECKFENMVTHRIEPTEHIKSQTFWANVERELNTKNLFNFDVETKPCACTS